MQLDLLLQQMPIGVFQANLAGGITQANPTLCQLIGYTDVELRRLDLQAITDPQNILGALEIIAEIVRYRESRVFESRWRCVNGALLWVEIKLSLVGELEDDAGYFLGFVTDVTDRHRIEAERFHAAQEIQKRQERETLLNNLAARIRSTLGLPAMLQSAADELRHSLAVDRVVVYQIFADSSGSCVTESVAPSFSAMKGLSFGADCIPPPHLEAYRSGRLWSADDVSGAGLSDCHVDMLAQVQVQGMVATGILSMDESLKPNQRQLWGLLAIHQCQSTRHWSADDRQLIEAVANQLAIALEQTRLLNQLTSYTQALEQRVSQRTHSLERSLRFEQFNRSLTECLHRDLDENHLFKTVVNGLLPLLNADACLVSVYNPTTNTFEVKFEALSSTVPLSISFLGEQLLLENVSNQCQQQLLDNQTCQFELPVANSVFLGLAYLAVGGNTELTHISKVISPIVGVDHTVGLLLIVQFQSRQFEPDEIKLVEQTTNYCAIALRQAQLYRQEHEQRLSSEYFRFFLENSNDVFVEYDRQLCYLSINAAGCALLNRSRHEIIGKTNQEVLQTETEVIDCLVQQAFDTAEKVYVDHEMRLPSGDRVFETVYAPITDTAGTVQRVIGICRDVTELKQQWQRLEDQNHHLAETTRLKQEFVATTSHELRTPLTAILGFSNVLLQEFFGELNLKQKDYVERIHSSGQHLLELINDILDLSRLEAGRMELDLQTVYVADICEGVVSLVQERAASQGLTLHVELDPDIDWIVVDPRRLKQMLLNLLTNAVKFTAQGTVGLKVYCHSGATKSLEPPHVNHATIATPISLIHFLVWDTGIGIAETDQRSLFSPFSQIDSSLARQHAGTGLGLVITRKLAELHGGRVTLESAVNQGSKFTISLPLQRSV